MHQRTHESVADSIETRTAANTLSLLGTQTIWQEKSYVNSPAATEHKQPDSQRLLRNETSDSNDAPSNMPGFTSSNGRIEGQPQTRPPEIASDQISIRRQIEAHESFCRSQSYVGKALDCVFKGDKKSLEQLKTLEKTIESSLKSGEINSLNRLQVEVKDTIDADMRALRIQDDINTYTGNGLKTVFLFLKGPVGYCGAAVSYALDQMRPSDSLATQLLDGSLGLVKGSCSKAAFSSIGSSRFNLPGKAVMMGMASRTLDAGLTRSTYFNNSDGSYSLASGLSSTVDVALNPQALLVDGAVFGASSILLKGMNVNTSELLRRSPFTRSVVTGATFGFVSGASGEAIRQHDAGESTSVKKILSAGGLNAAVSGIAALPGAFQSDPQLRSSIAAKTKELTAPGVLIVEDAAFMARAMEASLKAQGYKVSWVTGIRNFRPLTGITEQGADIQLRSNRFNVALIDGQVAGPFQGPEIVRQLRGRNLVKIGMSSADDLNTAMRQNGAEIAANKSVLFTSLANNRLDLKLAGRSPSLVQSQLNDMASKFLDPSMKEMRNNADQTLMKYFK